ncbi:hypothetical protein A9Q95_08330 [Rhodobacterales bacterium 59_46_T64]|nr:hypothetical protein A9Q95_08330 [Rhodobacterales bacterium 59_46_T64]
MSGPDATFEEGREAPLNLGAMDAADLKVISALVQDAVFPATEMTWRPRARRFALLLNRMRWEDQGGARHAPERVQSVLSFENVLSVASQGVSRDDKDLVLSVLTIAFDPGEDGAGHVILTLAGDGAIRLAVESIEATLKDVTRPYVAPSKKTPQHPD